jgi:hypothetical protein
MKGRRRLSVASLAVACLAVVAPPALAQTATPQDSWIHTPHAGDCSIVIDLPSGVPPNTVMLRLNDAANGNLTFTTAQTQPFVAVLAAPLVEKSVVYLLLAQGDGTSAHADVLAAIGGPPNACAPKEAPRANEYDDRQTFEANAFYGRVFDNFAPAEVLGVKYDKPATGNIDSRWTAGFQAAYRLFGAPTDVRQLWLSTQILHGARSADIDCTANPQAFTCPAAGSNPDPTKRILTTIEHASTMESHIEARMELFRLQGSTDTPVKVFASTRYGFIAMEGAPKVFSSDAYVGGGITTPKGSFRGSFAEVAWGRSRQFQSVPEANRLKIYGTLVFDLMPGLVGQAENVVSQAGSAMRLFAAIVVDRNPGGVAPDAVQTYVGIMFDVRRLVGSAF